MATYYWKKGFFKAAHQIYQDGEGIGWMKEKFWSSSAEAEWKGKQYYFQSVGFFKRSALIIDLQKNETIGDIVFSNWKMQATVQLNGAAYLMKRVSFWKSAYTLYAANGSCAEFQNRFASGVINATTDNGVLLLAGFFVILKHKQQQSNAAH
jgi:hypothetical protein